MGRLVYSAIASLDGFLADGDGDFSWAEPSPQVHEFINDLESTVGTHLMGRRMYEVMAVWDDLPEGMGAEMQAYAAAWQGIDKVVFSTTLAQVATRRTTLMREFDPAVVSQLVAASDKDVSIGGPTLAAEAFAVGMVHEVHLFALPVLIGAGLSCWPGVRCDLEPTDRREFGDGTVYLRYRVGR